jgi:hypothetical protein
MTLSEPDVATTLTTASRTVVAELLVAEVAVADTVPLAVNVNDGAKLHIS